MSALDAIGSITTAILPARDSAVTSRSHRLRWCIAALAMTVLFSIPLLMLVAAHGSYLPIVHEALRSLYFTNVRILNGEGGSVYLPHGQILTLAQHAILWTLRAVSGHSLFDLLPMLEWYALATSVLTIALYGCVAIAAALDRLLTWFDRVIVMAIGPFVLLTTGDAGFYYILMPAYYAVDVVITTASAYFTIALLRGSGPFIWRDLILAGLFWGIAASNKLTLLGPAGVVVIMAAVRSPLSPLFFIQRSITAAALALAAFLTIFLLCYLGQPSQVLIAIRSWFSFLSAAGPEVGFWDQNAFVFWSAYHYDIIAYSWIAGMACLVFAISQRHQWISRSSILLVAILAVAILLVASLVRRGSGTTSFEMAVIITGLSAIAFAAALGPRPRRQFGLPVLAAAAVLATINMPASYSRNWSVVVAPSGEIADRSWQIHEYANQVATPSGTTFVVLPAAQIGPALAVNPDFSYLWNGIEEFIAFGLVNSAGTPGAEIAKHSPFRPIRLVTDAAEAKPGDVIITAMGHERNVPALPSILPCRSWEAGYYSTLTVRVCPVVSPRGLDVTAVDGG
jgi:hypothetical protein